MPRTYENPQETAKQAAWIEKQNHFAHTIRLLERSISVARRKPFIIVVRYNIGAKVTKTDFNSSKSYCDIFLDDTAGLVDQKTFRLILAHELGHVFYNFDEIKNAGFVFDSEDAPMEEEIYAWVFAYWLVFEKSEMFKIRGGDNESIYEGKELKQALFTFLRGDNIRDGKTICKHVKEQIERQEQ